MNRIFGCILFIAIADTGTFGKTISPDSVWIDVVQGSTHRYVVGTIVTFAHPMPAVSEVLTDFNHFPRIFTYCTVFHRLPRDSCADNRETYFAEAKGNIIRVLGFGVIDSLYYSIDSTELKLKVTQDVSARLKELGKKRARGWFTINVVNINLRATLRRVDKETCTVVVNAWGNPDVYIPKWVLRFAVKTGFPQFVKDVEREVVQRRKGVLRK